MVATERATRGSGRWLVALALLGLGCDGGREPGSDDAGASDGSTGAGDPTTTDGGASEPDALDPAQAEAWRLAAFEAEVLPMLSARCSGCHGRVAAQLGLVLGPVGEVSAGEVLRGLVDREAVASPLSLVEPGQPEESWPWIKLDGDLEGVACNGGCGGPMPPAGEPPTDAEIEALTRWIAEMEPSP